MMRAENHPRCYPDYCPSPTCGAKNELQCSVCVKCGMDFRVELSREKTVLETPSLSFGCGMGFTPSMDAPHLEREEL